MDDNMLILRAIEGEKKAFEHLYEKYYYRIKSMAYSRIKDNHYAEDITQEVFIKAYLNLDKLSDISKFKAWINSITFNLCKNYYNRVFRKHYFGHFPLELTDMKKETISDGQLIKDNLRILSSVNRKTAKLFYIDGYSIKDISSILSIPIGTVKRRLHDSRKQLKKGGNCHEK